VDLGCYQNVSLHPGNSEPFDHYGVTLPQEEAALFQESHGRQPDQLTMCGGLKANLNHAAVRCCPRQVNDLCDFAFCRLHVRDSTGGCLRTTVVTCLRSTVAVKAAVAAIFTVMSVVATAMGGCGHYAKPEKERD
jgi:hypothetical protein